MMKKYFLWSLLSMFLVVLVSVLFTACSDKDDPSEIKANPDSVSFDANGEKINIMVTSNTGWNVSGYPSWITVSPTSGSNNQQVSISAGKNEGTSSRSGVVTFITSDGKASAMVQLVQEFVYFHSSTWEGNHRYSDCSTYTIRLTFISASTAQLVITYTEGTSSYTDRIDYRYTLPGDGSIVVLTPVEAGQAVLEGKIENGAKMILTNTSNGAEVAVLYKK